MIDPTVLILEDDEDQLLMLMRQLHSAGWTVVGVHSPVRALELADQRQFHVALVDIDLPGVSSEQVVRELREKQNQLPIVLLTPMNGGTATTEPTGAFCVLKKPYRPGEVEAVIEDALFGCLQPHADHNVAQRDIAWNHCVLL